MVRKFSGALSILLLTANTAAAQRTLSLDRVPELRGDASGAPAGCGTADAVTALRTWFRAVSTGDTTLIAKAIAPVFQWVTVARFVEADSVFDGRNHVNLTRYVAARGPKHETIEIEELQLNGWRGRDLQIGPFWYLRAADDLGPAPIQGLGKAVYRCGEGLFVLSTGRWTDPYARGAGAPDRR